MCLRCVEKGAIYAMVTKAKELNVYGVCVVLTTSASKPLNSFFMDPLIQVVDKFFDTRNATSAWSPTGASYWAIAMSKIAEMLETNKPSGTIKGRSPRKGEFGYKGGISWRRNNLKIFIAFSGGTQEQDLQIAEAGKMAMNQGLDLAKDLDDLLLKLLPFRSSFL